MESRSGRCQTSETTDLVLLWPEQKTFVCTVGTLAKTAAENNITKTALMIIGDTVAAAHYDRSKLYDPEFTTEFREAVKSKTHHS